MKKFMKKLAFVMAFAMVITSIPAFTAKAATAPSLKWASATKFIGQATSGWWIPVQNKGEYSTSYSTTSDLITVNKNNGKVTIAENAKPGKAVITVTYSLNGKVTGTDSFTLKIRRNAVAVKLMAAQEKKLETALNVGESFRLQVAKSYTENFTKGTFCWNNSWAAVSDSVKVTSSDPTVLSVDGYQVTALKPGTVKLTVETIRYKDITTASKEYTVVVAGPEAAGIASFEATDVDTFTVKFNAPVATSAAVKLARTTVNSSSPVTATETWNKDRTEVTLTIATKLQTGTYTVSVDKETATTEVREEYVAKIAISEDRALTSADNKSAYVYYDVFNQYGKSIRETSSVQWSVSGKYVDNRSEGKLTISNTDGSAYTYNTMISVTGVSPKSGASDSKIVYTGLPQEIGAAQIVGVTDKDGKTILDTIPANFKSGEYFLLYSVKDQNGRVIDATDNLITNKKVTFLSDNVLFIAPTFVDASVVTIGDQSYCAVALEPGTYVQEGGTVKFTVIANTTGAKDEKTFTSEAGQILTKFDIEQPTAIISDGQTGVEIPFKAYDQNGALITSYDVLVEEKSSLTLTTTVGKLYLKEQNNGTAKLIFDDDVMAWSRQAEDDVDRLVNFTAVVIGGDADSELIYIKDKAHPVAVTGYKPNVAYIENTAATFQIDNNHFTFVDQYGRGITDLSWFSYDNAVNGAPALKIAYTGAVDVVSGNAATFTTAGNRAEGSGNTAVYYIDNLADATYNDTIAFTAAQTETAKNVTFAFTIVQKDTNGQFNDLGKAFKATFYDIDIKQVSNIALGSIAKMAIQTDRSDSSYGKELNTNGDIAITGTYAGYESTLSVTGKYNGLNVTVPTDYFAVTLAGIVAAKDGDAYKLVVATGGAADGVFAKYDSYYDTTSYNDQRKDGSAQLTVTVYNAPIVEDNVASSAAIASGASVKTNLVGTLAFSDGAPIATEIRANDKTISAANTEMTQATILNEVTNKTAEDGVFDQYGKELAVTPTVSISDVVENANAFANGNFTTGNSGVIGAELGDTFNVMLSVVNEKGVLLTKTVKVTVGADSWAKYSSQSTPVNGQHDLETTLNNQRNELLAK